MATPHIAPQSVPTSSSGGQGHTPGTPYGANSAAVAADVSGNDGPHTNTALNNKAVVVAAIRREKLCPAPKPLIDSSSVIVVRQPYDPTFRRGARLKHRAARSPPSKSSTSATNRDCSIKNPNASEGTK